MGQYRTLLVDGQDYEQAYFTDGSRHVVSVRVGETDDPPCVYSVLCALEPCPMLPTGHEFTFCILEIDVETGEEYQYWSGLETRTKITPPHRGDCVQVVCDALRILLSECDSPIVFMQACDENLPLTARAKYERVIEIFVGCGYLAESQDPFHGRESWVMERIAP